MDLTGRERPDLEQLVDGRVPGDAYDHLTLTLAQLEAK
jgi:hypothetical protein